MQEELNKILMQVSELYNKYGIKSVTMDDVARHLGISKKTLYQYVTDKADLVSKVIQYDIKCKQELFNSSMKEPLNAIEEIFVVHRHVNKMVKDFNPSREYDLQKYYPELFKQIVKVRRERMLEHVKANLVKGKKEGLYRKDLHEEIISRLYVFRIETIHDSEIFSPNEIISSPFFKEIFNYHIRGIANEKGIQFLEKNIDKLNIDHNE